MTQRRLRWSAKGRAVWRTTRPARNRCFRCRSDLRDGTVRVCLPELDGLADTLLENPAEELAIDLGAVAAEVVLNQRHVRQTHQFILAMDAYPGGLGLLRRDESNLVGPGANRLVEVLGWDDALNEIPLEALFGGEPTAHHRQLLPDTHWEHEYQRRPVNDTCAHAGLLETEPRPFGRDHEVAVSDEVYRDRADEFVHSRDDRLGEVPHASQLRDSVRITARRDRVLDIAFGDFLEVVTGGEQFAGAAQGYNPHAVIVGRGMKEHIEFVLHREGNGVAFIGSVDGDLKDWAVLIDAEEVIFVVHGKYLSRSYAEAPVLAACLEVVWD